MEVLQLIHCGFSISAQGGALGKEVKYFQEMKARFQLPAAAFLPSLTLGLGVGILGPCSKCVLCLMVFQEFQDTGIFTQLCCVLPFSNLKLLIQRKSEWGA